MAHPTTSAPAPSSAVQPDGPLDLHVMYQHSSACGFDHDLLLRAPSAQSLAAHLRGIRAIVAVLTTESGGDVDLGEWMRAGLVEAIDALASKMDDILYRSNERAQEQQADANERLCAMLRSAVSPNDDMEHVVVRGLSMRIKELAKAVMDAIGDEMASTAEIARAIGCDLGETSA